MKKITRTDLFNFAKEIALLAANKITNISSDKFRTEFERIFEEFCEKHEID